MRQYGGDAWAVSPCYDIVREIRVIVLDSDVLLAYEKRPVMHDGVKIFNLGRGAIATNISIDSAAREMILASLQAIGLRVAAVDYIEFSDGSRSILEVNDGIMMENYMRQSDEYTQVAREVYAAIIDRMFK